MADATATEEAPAAAPVEAAPKAAASKDKKGKGEKGKGEKKGKKGKAGDGAPADGGPSIAAHPRAARSVARAKAWGGLCGFLLAGYFSLHTGTAAETLARALLFGIVGRVGAWAAAVFIWRRLVVLEVKAREQQLIDAARPAAVPGPRTLEGRASGKAA